MTKKGSGTRDSRSEPDSEGASENFRVDRVFAPTRPSSPSRPPPKPPTMPPPAGTTPPQNVTASDSETELALRRQLSRLQRQLADAQRELANKDEEVAAAVEKRLEIQQAYDVILEEQRQTRALVDDAMADRSRTSGVEQRLQEALAAADELRHQLERERTERATVAMQLEEATASFDKSRTAWREESAAIDEQHIAQIAQLEHQKRAAVDAAEAAMKTSTERQFQAHEAELEALRAAHQRELGALRGEIEPKVSEARNLIAEIERLTAQLQAQAAEHQSLLAERIELHTWEMQQHVEASAADLAALQRQHSAEVSRLNEEVSAANQAGQLIERNSTLREQLWEQTVQSLRDGQKKAQQELADARERAAQAEASKWSVETRLVGTLQALEKTTEELRAVRDKLELQESEVRRSGLDRQRFAAYLEEGLAMLGALPPKAEIDDQELAVPHESAMDVGSRPTRNYAAIDPDIDIEIPTPMPEDLEPEIEADPLPEPTRPGALRDSKSGSQL